MKDKFTDEMIKVPNYKDVALQSNVGNLKGMKKEVLTSQSHGTSRQPPFSLILSGELKN